MNQEDPKHIPVIIISILLFIIICLFWIRYHRENQKGFNEDSLFSNMFTNASPFFQESLDSFKQGTEEVLQDDEYQRLIDELRFDVNTTTGTSTSE